MLKRQFILPSLVLAAALASLLMHRRTQVQLQENDALSRQYATQLVALRAANQRLSNLVAQARTDTSTAYERTAELGQLRAKAEALRQQANRLARQLAERRLSAGVQFFASSDFNLLAHNDELRITFGGGPRAENGKLNDARALTAALRKYADEHQGNFPRNPEQVSPYLPKPLQSDSPPWADAPLSGTNEFEIVYQGSQNDLTNIPGRRVALIRERQPWPTAPGKWARVYGYADGAASIVASDDNFQSWDAQHVIPVAGSGP